ncbi:Protein CBG27529 [Caenorhabditis briggsae]|uniref:Protein CBG27529 n=2 Tax=Caenorhabditis briggsae TaxID=6238 RepID=B6IKJ0_CAEBR|nr:Protein CBG27529 [Caenorhabditis briggsae]ULT80917.1 hypothetical protein L3Y34_011053 [Caenorhabditis briggsae]CAS00420.1 Protein CBG27529 [Caenorhabditis briggsae]
MIFFSKVLLVIGMVFAIVLTQELNFQNSQLTTTTTVRPRPDIVFCDSKVMATNVITMFNKDVFDRNETAFEWRFVPEFKFTGCLDTYGKDEVVQKIAAVPRKVNLVAVYEDVRCDEWYHMMILNVTVYGILHSPMLTEIVVNPLYHEIKNGRILDCIHLI